MNSEICSNFSGFRCWNWRLIMILGNFSCLLDMCKIFDKYHVWSWAPTSIWGPSVRGPNWTGAQVSVFLRVDTWAPKKGAKTTAVFLYFCILNPPPTKTATVFLYLQYNPDHSKTIQHIHWNPSQHLSSYIYMVCMTFRCYWYILAIFTLRGTLKYPNHLLPNVWSENLRNNSKSNQF